MNTVSQRWQKPGALATGALKTKLYLLLLSLSYQAPPALSWGNWFEKQRHSLHTEQASSKYFHAPGSN